MGFDQTLRMIRRIYYGSSLSQGIVSDRDEMIQRPTKLLHSLPLQAYCWYNLTCIT